MTYTTRISCDKANLKLVRDFVSDVLKGYSIPDTEVNLVVVAVDEVCSNLIIHAHNCNDQESIDIEISHNKSTFVFEIIDRGSVFDISRYDAPSIDKIIKNKKMGGIGLILVKKIMDKIQIEQNGGRNICRLYKTLSLPS